MGQGGSPGKQQGRMEREESPSAPDDGCCRFFRFPLLVAVLQLLLGVAVAAVAFLTLAISPSSLLARETPHWAGIILCLVSIIGFILYCVNYRPDERSSVQFIVKLLYFILCMIGLVISLLAMAFAGHHYSQSMGFSCEAEGEDCVCTADKDDPIARTFTYQGVSDCQVITGTLPFYFLIQILLNLAQALVCAVGAFIMWKQRYQVFFAGLQIGSPSSKQWQKV